MIYMRLNVSFLFKCFRIKDLEFSHSKNGIFMPQRKYALDILQESRLLDAHSNNFPMEQNLKLTSIDGMLLNDPTKYRRIVGRLIYLTIIRIYSVHTLN